MGHIRLSVLPPGSGRPELPTPQESLHPGLSGQAMAVISERLILWVVIVWLRMLSTAERAKIRSACGISVSWEVEALYAVSLHFLSSKKTGNEYKKEFKQVFLWRTTAIILSIAYGNSSNHVEKVKKKYRYIISCQNSVKSGNVKILTACFKNT